MPADAACRATIRVAPIGKVRLPDADLIWAGLSLPFPSRRSRSLRSGRRSSRVSGPAACSPATSSAGGARQAGSSASFCLGLADLRRLLRPLDLLSLTVERGAPVLGLAGALPQRNVPKSSLRRPPVVRAAPRRRAGPATNTAPATLPTRCGSPTTMSRSPRPASDDDVTRCRPDSAGGSDGEPHPLIDSTAASASSTRPASCCACAARSTRSQLAGIAKRFEGGKAILFEVKGSAWPVLVGLLWNRGLVGSLFGVAGGGAVSHRGGDRVRGAHRSAIPSALDRAPANEVIEPEVDLTETAGPGARAARRRAVPRSVVVAQPGDRCPQHPPPMMITGPDRLSFSSGRHLGEPVEIAERRGEVLPVTINNGVGGAVDRLALPRLGDFAAGCQPPRRPADRLRAAQTVDVPGLRRRAGSSSRPRSCPAA